MHNAVLSQCKVGEKELKRWLYASLILVLTLFSCSEPRPTKQITPGIYHWKSTYNPTDSLLHTSEELGICKQYIRFFDVDNTAQNHTAAPVSVVKFQQKPQVTVVPVIYITNRTLIKKPKADIDALAKKVWSKTQQIAIENDIDIKEIQLDCDWTQGTQQNYFRFIEKLNHYSGDSLILTSTIRLHQIKFREKTGVPPVNRGVLMLYNVGDWTNIDTENSLFDPEVIDEYIDRASSYPIALDIALPIYNQTVVYRNDVFFSYLKNSSPKAINNHINLQKTEKQNFYECTDDCTLGNTDFRKGDIFRHESVDFEELNQIKQALLNRIRNRQINILFYHLDERSFDNFTYNEFKKLLRDENNA